MRTTKLSSILIPIIFTFAQVSGSSVLAAEMARPRVDKATSAFQRPLIIGASVSSGLLTTSPGDRAAQRYGTSASVTNIARAGSSGRDSMNINAENLRGYSLVIGIDFLFWDSTGGNMQKSLLSLRNLIASAASARVPLVLGDIPLLREQPARDVLNRSIHALCRVQRGCYVIPLAHLFEVASNRGIVINGRLYHYQDLTIDGLHVNEVGSEYIASMIIAALQRY